jgi:hypothetical protein
MSANRSKSRNSSKSSKSSKIESNYSKYSGRKEYMKKLSAELKEYMKIKEYMKNNYEKRNKTKQKDISEFSFEATEYLPYYREDIQIPDSLTLRESLENLKNELKDNPEIIHKMVAPLIVSPTPEVMNSIADPNLINHTPVIKSISTMKNHIPQSTKSKKNLSQT